LVAGMAWVFVADWLLGSGERRRLGVVCWSRIGSRCRATEGTERAVAPAAWTGSNGDLTIALIVATVAGCGRLPCGIGAFAIALVVNYARLEQQRERMVKPRRTES